MALNRISKATYKTISGVSLSIAVFFSVALFFSSKDTLMSLYIGLSFGLVIFIWSVMDELLGLRRHQRIVFSRGFSKLQTLGFVVEEKNRYRGLSGKFDDYNIDIYYDWSTYVRPRIYKAIVFNVYFIPVEKVNGEVDTEVLDELFEKYKVNRWSIKTHSFSWRNGHLIMRVGAGFMNPSYKKLRKHLRIAVDILKSERLSPADRKTIKQWRQEFPNYNVPEIITY